MAFPELALTAVEQSRLEEIRRRDRTSVHQLRVAPTRRFVLSERQLQIVRLMSNGLKDSEIADELHISRNTAVSHAKHIYASLGARSRAHAVAIALRAGLIE